MVASSAIRDDNPELAEARRRGLRVLHRSAALGSIMLGRRGVAVAGTHGKTTTTAMVSHVLTGVGADPSYVIGGALTGASTGGHIGGGDAFVVEADESDGSFLQYPAEIAVVTNVDPDHLSNWGSAENYADGFFRFATAAPLQLLVISADDPGAVTLTERVRAAGSGPRILTYGESATADVQITEATFAGTGSTFRLDGEPVRLNVPGAYNVWNAAAAYAVACHLGATPAQARAELETYGGTYRRFQLVGTVDDIRVYDDYAHHPTEVANTLRAARTGVAGTGGRVVVCYQPHLYTRTRDFWRELAAALELADQAIVMDVCGDREDPDPGHRRRPGGRGGRLRHRRGHLPAGLGRRRPDGRPDRPTRRPGHHRGLRRRDQGGAADRGRPPARARCLMATATQTRPPSVADGKRRRRPKGRRVWPFVLVGVLVLALVGGLVWLVGFSSVLAAQRVQISGLKTLTRAEVNQKAAVPLGVPLARQDLSAVAGRVATFPQAENVVVERSWPDTITITVTERTPVFAVRYANLYVLVDKRGIPYLTVSERPVEPPAGRRQPGRPGQPGRDRRGLPRADQEAP